MRISREQMLMEMAYTASKRGTCGRLAVGAIIARDARPISLGYVGPPPGEPHCEEFGCDLTKPCTRTLHAESNAIKWAKAAGIDIAGADMFATDSPCLTCAMEIVGARLARVYFDREYRVSAGVMHLVDNKIEVHRVLFSGICRRIA